MDLVWRLDNPTDNYPVWKSEAVTNTGRKHHISFRLGNDLYMGMGVSQNAEVLKTVELLDKSKSPSSWKYVESYPYAVMHATCVVLPGEDEVNEVWVAGGLINDKATDNVYSWRGDNYNWQKEESLISARYGHSMVVDGTGYIWVLGGSSNVVEMYNKIRWESLHELPALMYGISICWSDFIILVGGYGIELNGNDFEVKNSVYVLNLTNKTGAYSTTTLRQAVYNPAAVVITQ